MAQRSNVREEDKNLCEWITIVAPQTIHIPPAMRSETWPWLEALHALLARNACEGCQGCQWGRVLEDQEKIWVWTSWKNTSYYEEQKQLPETVNAYAKLATVSTVPLTTELVLFDQERPYAQPTYSWRQLDSAWPSVTMIHFPTPLSPGQTKYLRLLDDSRCISRAVFHLPSRGFRISENKDILGGTGPDQQHVVYVMRETWVNPSREQEVNSPGCGWSFVDEDGALVCHSEYQEKQARKIGCIDFVIRHVKLNTVDDLLEQIPEVEAEGQSVLFNPTITWVDDA
ncbi:hypothetical protein K491DRAFT_684052 [Lophiostoma macrostomum CBS 122681]|uniref:ABM domain-containing protein n=1 Tax=Lophiostoma macrostomum CBS 122681 TaxID=1314788 RepID=A0A6A6SMU1_9PLEO|nr:hypothetical protein K491DRAFT_684052 [Lophiostoma macrostomum CBS 122681]